MRLLDSVINRMNMNLGKLWEIVEGRESCYAVVCEVPESDTT